jgi:hypothetical protein
MQTPKEDDKCSFTMTVRTKAYNGWSTAITGICPGFRRSVDFFTISMACFIIAGDLACSQNNGRREHIAGGEFAVESSFAAW